MGEESSGNIKLSIKIPTDRLDLSESDRDLYAALGFFAVRCADLEFELDAFIFEYAKLKTRLVRSTRNFPFKMDDKIDFFIASFIETRALRSCGDAEDILDLNSIGYLLEELWEARKHLIHGSIYFSHHDTGNFRFASTRYVREEKNKYRKETFEINREALIYFLDNIQYLKNIIRNASAILSGEDPKREYDQLRKNRANARELRQALLEQGIEIDPTGLMRFFTDR